jgi:hypothetical protein
MPSSGIWRRVDIVLTDVSEERIASIIKVSKINEPGTCVSTWLQAILSSETSVHTRYTLHYIPEDCIFLLTSLFNQSFIFAPDNLKALTLFLSVFVLSIFSFVTLRRCQSLTYILPLTTCSRWLIPRGFLVPWRWWRFVLPKRQSTQYLHGFTSQKTALSKKHISRINILTITYVLGNHTLPRFESKRQQTTFKRPGCFENPFHDQKKNMLLAGELMVLRRLKFFRNWTVVILVLWVVFFHRNFP